MSLRSFILSSVYRLSSRASPRWDSRACTRARCSLCCSPPLPWSLKVGQILQVLKRRRKLQKLPPPGILKRQSWQLGIHKRRTNSWRQRAPANAERSVRRFSRHRSSRLPRCSISNEHSVLHINLQVPLYRYAATFSWTFHSSTTLLHICFTSTSARDSHFSLVRVLYLYKY